MHQLKLVLPLAGLLVAGQALAHKASHASTANQASARSPLVQPGSIPAVLLDGADGRGARATAGLPATATAQAIVQRHRYTRSH